MTPPLLLKAILAFGWLTACASAAAADDVPQVLGAAGGRYVFGQISGYHSDQYLLDTQTGRSWVVTCYDDPPPVNGGVCHDRRFRPMPFAAPVQGDVSILDLVPGEPARALTPKK